MENSVELAHRMFLSETFHRPLQSATRSSLKIKVNIGLKVCMILNFTSFQ